MKDPIDLELARYRAQADQLASTLRDMLLEMDRGEVAGLIRACGKGELSGLDEKALGLVGFLALVGFFGLFEPGGD